MIDNFSSSVLILKIWWHFKTDQRLCLIILGRRSRPPASEDLLQSSISSLGIFSSVLISELPSFRLFNLYSFLNGKNTLELGIEPKEGAMIRSLRQSLRPFAFLATPSLYLYLQCSDEVSIEWPILYRFRSG